MPNEKQTGANRPPVVAIVGHIDHGKSTLLDYIRKANVVAGEAGGITQHIGAYEAAHNGHSITFLDTPGHEAFIGMRGRGLSVADVAILVISAEEGAKPQTLEAVRQIGEAEIPYIVAFTKIDKPDADIERAKNSLLQNGVYLEGLGGNVPYIGVSGKTGDGISELLDLILLQAELEGLSADIDASAQGIVIEAHIDRKRGISATLIIENGTLRSGSYVVAGAAFAPVRIMENFLGKNIKEATPGMPVGLIGFSSLPKAGQKFNTVASKKEAEEVAHTEELRLKAAFTAASLSTKPKKIAAENEAEPVAELQKIILPVVIKTDVAGAGEAVLHEMQKISSFENMEVRVVSTGVGAISEADVKLAGSGETPGLVIGFNVTLDEQARLLGERLGVSLATFDVIYKLGEWLQIQFEEKRPRAKVEEKTGSARVIKIFSSTKRSLVLGGKVEEGVLKDREEVRIMRRDLELGRGTIDSLQSLKKNVKEVETGNEFGALIKTDVTIAAGDRLEAFDIQFK